MLGTSQDWKESMEMGERVILVCDVCSRPAVNTVTIKVGRQNFAKDLCEVHLSELTSGARRPRPGRRRAVVSADTAGAAPRRRGRPPKSTPASTGTRRRGRPRKTQTAGNAAG
jgi:hypothetical protein